MYSPVDYTNKTWQLRIYQSNRSGHFVMDRQAAYGKQEWIGSERSPHRSNRNNQPGIYLWLY
jgi:hypothetical protein